MLSSLLKPEYLYQPWRLVKRCFSPTKVVHGKPGDFILNNGLPLHVDSCDVIADAIAVFGVYDLAVSETILRLSPPNGTVMDIGANIGVMSAMMAQAVAPSGRVISIEPHPEIYANLEKNAAVWRARTNVDIRTLNIAASGRQCELELHFPKNRIDNNGMATLEASSAGAAAEGVRVKCERLDDIVPSGGIDCIKMDVEGHELSVLKGATKLLTEGRARNWIFEEHSMYPSPVSAYFEQNGFRIFYLKKCKTRVELVDPKTSTSAASVWEAPSFLATLDAERVMKIMSKSGWLAFKTRS